MLRRPVLFAVALAASAVAISPAFGASLGNSSNAHACQKGGWQTMALSSSPTVPFASQGACVHAGAARAALVQLDSGGGWEPPSVVTAREICEQTGYAYNESNIIQAITGYRMIFKCGQASDGLTAQQIWDLMSPSTANACFTAGGSMWQPATDQLVAGDFGLQPETGWYAVCWDTTP